VKRGGKNVLKCLFTLYVDLNEEEALYAITQTWGVANWKIVDGFGTPFPAGDLRDGTTYFALKEGEALANRKATRSYSKFTVNKVSDEMRFMIKCGNQIHHVWMKPVSRFKINEVCKTIWGPGYYKWNDEDTKELQGRVLHIQKSSSKKEGPTVLHFKISYEDEPGKPLLMDAQGQCGTQVYEFEKILRCCPGTEWLTSTRNAVRFSFDTSLHF
jgi:hypothetical protein